jgi:hypothetical protein
VTEFRVTSDQEHRDMRMTRLTTGMTVAVPVLATILAGCASGSVSVAAAATGAGAARSTAGIRATNTAGAAIASAAASAVGAAAAAGEDQASGSGGTRCHTGDLSLHVIQGPQDGGTMGDFYVQLTNTSAHTCTFYGFPGVDLLGDAGPGNGASLGMKDIWSVKLAMTGGRRVQTLAPNEASAAYVTFDTRPAGGTAGYPRAARVSVIPPDETTALSATIDNVESGAVQLLVASATLTVGPMDVDGVPHK